MPGPGLTHRADGGVGGDAADEEACHRHDGARGEDGGEALAQSLYRRLLALHLQLQLQIAVGDDDGVVDGGAHLNGADHQIAQEEEVGVSEYRHREVDPDGALNGEHQQNGQARRLEGKQQDHHDEQGGEDADF